MKYRIIKKFVKGIEIVGYVVVKKTLQDDGSILEQEEILKTSDILSLCNRKLVENAELILDSDTAEYDIYIEDFETLETVVSKPKQKDLNLVGKQIITNEDGKKQCIGYIVKDSNGRQQKINSLNAWKYAKNNCINNVRATIINNKKALISVGEQPLDKLHRMNV